MKYDCGCEVPAHDHQAALEVVEAPAAPAVDETTLELAQIDADARVASDEAYNDTRQAEIDAETERCRIEAEAAVAIAEVQAEADVAIAEVVADAITAEGDEPMADDDEGAEAVDETEDEGAGEPETLPADAEPTAVSVPPQLADEPNAAPKSSRAVPAFRRRRMH